MGANDLKASLTLNSTSYETALARADAAATRFANKVQGQLSKKIGGLLGATAIGGMLASPLHKLLSGVFGLGDRANEIESGSKKLGVTTTEYQQIEQAAKASGLGVDQFIDAVRRGEIPLSKAIETIRAFRAELKASEIAAVQSADASIERASKDLQSGLATLSNIWGDFWRYLGTLSVYDEKKDKGSILQVLKDLRKEDIDAVNPPADRRKSLEQLLTEKPKGGGGVRPDFGVNELQKIGAFVGGGDPAVTELKTIAKHTENTSISLKQLADKAKAGNASVLDIFSLDPTKDFSR